MIFLAADKRGSGGNQTHKICVNDFDSGPDRFFSDPKKKN
jgi:hypothetical protein